MDITFNVLGLFSVFMVIFAVIDIFGTLPIIVELRNSGKTVNASKTTIVATVILFSFLFGGELLLKLFNVNVSSFAVAGSIILFFLSLEMILGLKLFKNEQGNDATVIPLAFPLIAGPGSLTTLISLRAEYSVLVISIALSLNIAIVYLGIRLAEPIEQKLGASVNFIMKKFFGIILLAMAVKLFASNIQNLMGN